MRQPVTGDPRDRPAAGDIARIGGRVGARGRAGRAGVGGACTAEAGGASAQPEAALVESAARADGVVHALVGEESAPRGAGGEEMRG